LLTALTPAALGSIATLDSMPPGKIRAIVVLLIMRLVESLQIAVHRIRNRMLLTLTRRCRILMIGGSAKSVSCWLNR
jgi:hypothetical protein